VLVVYLVLGILYESFVHPLTILSGLPSGRPRRPAHPAAVRRRSEPLRLRRHHHAHRHRQEERHHDDRLRPGQAAQRGRAAPKAIFEACLVRFRPIMMTTFAALAGTLPIAIGWGAGAEIRQPLGLAVVGGLVPVPVPDPRVPDAGAANSTDMRPDAISRNTAGTMSLPIFSFSLLCMSIRVMMPKPSAPSAVVTRAMALSRVSSSSRLKLMPVMLYLHRGGS
jgi:hypothetical protein